MKEHHLVVPRTARYHSLGEPSTAKALWVMLHGYGHLARYFLNTFEELEDGVLIIAPEALSRFYLDEGHTRVGATWMTREDRDQEMADQLTYLDRLAQKTLLLCPRETPLHVLGFSQGVAVACRWATRGVSEMKQLVLWGGNIPPELDTDLLNLRLRQIAVDLVHGEEDRLAPEAVHQKNEATLRAAKVPFNAHRFNGGHELDKLVLQRLVKG
jgi:predicted esterase